MIELSLEEETEGKRSKQKGFKEIHRLGLITGQVRFGADSKRVVRAGVNSAFQTKATAEPVGKNGNLGKS